MNAHACDKEVHSSTLSVFVPDYNFCLHINFHNSLSYENENNKILKLYIRSFATASSHR